MRFFLFAIGAGFSCGPLVPIARDAGSSLPVAGGFVLSGGTAGGNAAGGTTAGGTAAGGTAAGGTAAGGTAAGGNAAGGTTGGTTAGGTTAGGNAAGGNAAGGNAAGGNAAGGNAAGGNAAGGNAAGGNAAGGNAAGGNAAGGIASCPPGMALLPAGSFVMGTRTTPDGGPDVVTIAPFCLDFTEVTVRAFHASDAGAAPTPMPSCNGNQSTRQLHPANCIDWFQALRYCTAIGKRLPSEDEFEWAARGTTAGTGFPWGNAAPSSTQVCWLRQPASGTCEAGTSTLGRSPQGIDDLAGNVWEWTSSCADSFCASRLARGGGWFTSSEVFLAASYRDARLATAQSDVIGVRCALTP